MNRDKECNHKERHRHAANKWGFRARTGERPLRRVPYLEESECSNGELGHEREDHRGDDDGYRGSGPNGDGANGGGVTGEAAQAVRV